MTIHKIALFIKKFLSKITHLKLAAARAAVRLLHPCAGEIRRNVQKSCRRTTRAARPIFYIKTSRKRIPPLFAHDRSHVHSFGGLAGRRASWTNRQIREEFNLRNMYILKCTYVLK
jgi:hypothetical protein